MSGDPIADYLAELRAGLRTAPARTAEILTTGSTPPFGLPRPGRPVPGLAQAPVIGSTSMVLSTANAHWPAGIGHQASARASWLIEPAPRLAGRGGGNPARLGRRQPYQHPVLDVRRGGPVAVEPRADR